MKLPLNVSQSQSTHVSRTLVPTGSVLQVAARSRVRVTLDTPVSTVKVCAILVVKLVVFIGINFHQKSVMFSFKARLQGYSKVAANELILRRIV